MCHPSHAPGGCGHGVGVDLPREVRNQYPNNVFSFTSPTRDNTGPLRTELEIRIEFWSDILS